MKTSLLLKRTCRYLCFLFLLPLFSFAQQSSRPFTVGIQSYYGFLLRHKPALGGITQGHPFGAELYYEGIKAGQQYWEKAYHYPSVGFALGYFDMHSPKIGQMIYVLHYLEKDLAKGNKGALKLKLGYGLAYCTHPFNLEDNYQNIAISTRLSYALRTALGYSIALSDNLKLHLGLTITHFSNGSFKIPNSGTNLVMANLGLSFTPQSKKIIYQTVALPPAFSKKWIVNLSAAFIIKEFDLPGGRKYPGMVLMANLSRRLNYKSAINIGLDGAYNTALREEINRDSTIDPEHKPDFKRVGLVVGHELFFNERLSLLTQVGVYIYKHYTSNIDAPIYQRYGLRYHMNKRLFGTMSLKSHFGTADFVEWTVGVNL
ncbi:MAG: acyloxyacyl hydrolase [Bacteroidota bacterium]